MRGLCYFAVFIKEFFIISYILSCRSKIYNLYDIYNNARNLGGKLNIVFDQNFIIDTDGSKFLKKSNEMKKTKYQYRGNMNDITLRIGVNVTIGTFSISYISNV